MPRKIVRPYGQSITSMRALSLLMMLGLLWMMYDWARTPSNWRFLADDRGDAVSIAPVDAKAKESTPKLPPEVIIPGPNELDPEEIKEFEKKRLMIADRTKLLGREMWAYWRMMGWALSEPMQKLEKRAAKDVAFTQIWEEPDRYRGKPVRLRLHVRRVLHHQAPENPQKIKDVYEAWGWTDESKSFPYLVVFSERPPGMPLGSDVRCEMVFVGYFLKTMSYEAFDVVRGTPLLIGRARMATTAAPRKPEGMSGSVLTILTVVGLIAFVFLGVRHMMSFRRKPKNILLPDRLTSGGAESDSPEIYNPFVVAPAGESAAASPFSGIDNFDTAPAALESKPTS